LCNPDRPGGEVVGTSSHDDDLTETQAFQDRARVLT